MYLFIYCYGYGEAMFKLLNAMAMLFNHNFVIKAMELIILLAIARFALMIAYGGMRNWQPYALKLISIIVFVGAGLNQKATMLVTDHIRKEQMPVSNIPLAFALPIAFIETIGNAMTTVFEQALVGLNNKNYHEFGMVFGARLIREARDWRIRNPEFAQNMDTFIRRCAIKDALIGANYTISDLLTTNNMWGLVKEKAGTLRTIIYSTDKTRELVTCKEASIKLEDAFKTELFSFSRRKEKSDFANSGKSAYTYMDDTAIATAISTPLNQINSLLKNNIKDVYSSYLGTNPSLSAEDIIRQQMMINSLYDYGNTYGDARMLVQQETAWQKTGDLAEYYLPIYLALIKGIVYMLFIFVTFHVLAGGGIAKYSNYLMLVLSLQLWPLISIIINSFIDGFSGSVSELADSVISFSSIRDQREHSDKIVVLANACQVFIPMISVYVARGSMDTVVTSIGGMLSGVQSPAGFVASELTTGSRNYDNVSMGNQQFATQSGFKTDFDTSYLSGSSTTRHGDGTIQRITSDGSSILQSGGGITASSGLTSYHRDANRHAQVQEGVQHAQSIHDQKVNSYSDAKTNTFNKVADMITNLAERQASGEDLHLDKQGSEGKLVQHAVDSAVHYAKNNGHNYETASRQALQTAINGGLNVGGLLSLGGVDAGVSASLSDDRSMASVNNNGTNKDVVAGQEHSIQRNFEMLAQAASNINWDSSHSKERQMSEGIRTSLDTQHRLEQAVSQSQQNLDDWHKTEQIINSSGASSSRDMYQEVVDGIKQNYGVNEVTAHRMADQRSPEAQKVWRQIQASDHFVQDVKQQVARGKQQTSNDAFKEQEAQFLQKHNIDDKNDKWKDPMVQHATNIGFAPQTIEKNIADKKSFLQHEYDQYETTATNQFNKTRADNFKEIDHLKKDFKTKESTKQKIGRQREQMAKNFERFLTNKLKK